MANRKLLVSVGVPLYNEERYLDQALQSLLSQSVENFELIISDNASTDHTGEICFAYAAKDPRVRYYRLETNLGSNANFNRVFRSSNATYFFWASGHDIWHETFGARCTEILEQDASVALCYPAARWIEPDGHLGDVIAGYVETRGMSRLGEDDRRKTSSSMVITSSPFRIPPQSRLRPASPADPADAGVAGAPSELRSRDPGSTNRVPSRGNLAIF